MSKITYAEVARRKQLQQVRNVVGVTENARLYNARLEANDTLENARNFVTECAKDATVAEYYLEDLQSYTDKYYDDPTIKHVFENTVIPMITLDKRDTVMEGHGWEYGFKRAQVCDRIIDNMNLIETKNPKLVTAAESKTVTDDDIVDLCCETVVEYNLPLVAKVNIAIEEAMMLLGKREVIRGGKYVDENRVVKQAIDTMSVLEDLTAKQMQEVNISLANSPVLENYDPSKLKSRFKAVEELFTGLKTDSAIDKVFEEGIERVTAMHNIFDASYTLSKSPDDDVVAAVFGNLSSLPERFMNKYVDRPVCKVYAEALLERTENELAHMRSLQQFSEGEFRERYCEVLKELAMNMKAAIDFIYPNYNTSMLIQNESVLNKAKGVISMVTAADKLKKIGNDILKARKWVDGKAHMTSIGGKACKALRVAGSKSKFLRMLDRGITEGTVYEYLTPEGRIDITIERFIVDDEASVDSSVHEVFNNICREINDNIFAGRSDNEYCYYIATENLIEVHYTNTDVVELTEAERNILVDETVNEEFDFPMIYEMMRFSTLPDEFAEFNEASFINNATNFIVEHKDEAMENFDTFLELAALATIDKDVVQEIFNEVSPHMPVIFPARYGYSTSIYEPIVGDTDVTIEAFDFLYDMIQEKKVDYNEKYKDVMDEDDNKYDTPDDDIKSARKEAKSKVNPKKEKPKKEKNEKETKTLDFNGAKLFLMGLKKKMKDMNAKEQNFCRNLDSSFNRLVRAMKQALVSDRREAIIKGSVIPSLSKSIKIGCAIAGTAVINPIAPVITAVSAFAMSKHLTKKERTLLLDDIEIEMKVLEKEISNAESDNNTKKMRALMKEQRNLQRQYQRIKYNIRVGKDIIPGGTGGNE